MDRHAGLPCLQQGTSSRLIRSLGSPFQSPQKQSLTVTHPTRQGPSYQQQPMSVMERLIQAHSYGRAAPQGTHYSSAQSRHSQPANPGWDHLRQPAGAGAKAFRSDRYERSSRSRSKAAPSNIERVQPKHKDSAAIPGHLLVVEAATGRASLCQALYPAIAEVMQIKGRVEGRFPAIWVRLAGMRYYEVWQDLQGQFTALLPGFQSQQGSVAQLRLPRQGSTLGSIDNIEDWGMLYRGLGGASFTGRILERSSSRV
jgi:hypothetical protein